MLRNMASLHRCINYCSFIWGGQKQKSLSLRIFLLFRLRSHLKDLCFGFHQGFQTPRNNKSTRPCGLVLSSVSRCLEPLMKPSHSVLICYMKHNASCLIYYLNLLRRYIYMSQRIFAFSVQNWNVVSSLVFADFTGFSRKRYQAIVPVRTSKISCKFANFYNARVELISLALFSTELKIH